MHVHPEVHTLQDLHAKLDQVVGHSGPRGGFYAADRRAPLQAPTFAQWAMHHGLKLDSLGSSQKESWQKTYRRVLEAQLTEVFGESNWQVPEGVTPHVADFLGYDMQREGQQIDVKEFHRIWSSHDNKPRNLSETVALLLKLSLRQPVRTSWASKKKRTGRRTGGAPPTFVQWAAAAKVSSQINRLSSTDKDSIRRLFEKAIEAELTDLFWPVHGETVRTRRSSLASGRQLTDSVTHGSFVGNAYRARHRQRATDPRHNEIFKWTRGRFVDFGETEALDFIQRFPEVKAADAIHIGNSVWDSKNATGQLTNFTKFLRRLAAYATIKRIRPAMTSVEVHDTIFHDVNSLFNVVKAAVQAKTKSTIQPLDFIAKLPSMPGILTTDNIAMKTILQDIDHRFPELMSQDAFLDELAVRVQLGGTRKQAEPLRNIVDRITREEGAAFVERKHGAAGAPINRFALDTNRVPAPATLDGLQNVQFGLPSTNQMVRTKLRKGTEGFRPIGAGFFGAPPHGGTGPLRQGVDHNTQDLIRQIANELIATRSFALTNHGRARRQARYADRRASLGLHNRPGN